MRTNGHTWEEHERLKLRGSPHFAVVSAAMKIGGRLSKGIELGWKSGFDSGRSLDYVYENRPQGSSRLGRFVDANYLRSIGWRGIRQRKANLETALREVIEKVVQDGSAIRILDVAAGAGRYVLETMRSLPEIQMSAILCDNEEENVAAARALAEEFGLQDRVLARRADAFDRAGSRRSRRARRSGLFPGSTNYFPRTTRFCSR